MKSINRHFRLESWLMVGTFLGPLALGFMAALVLPAVLAPGKNSVDSPDAAIAASRQAWRSISEKTSKSPFNPASTTRFEPYSATLEDGVWVVHGTVAAGYRGEILITRVRQSDGAVELTSELIK
jgi:hypothetical protein